MASGYDLFLATDLSHYADEWVALDGKKILSHGKDVKKVYEEAKKVSPKPFLTKIPSEKTMIF